jgi:PAT family beta-lactamase induction signal transducer AmpG
MLAAAIVFLGSRDPVLSPWSVALGALLVAAASATQDIVIDAFRVEKLEVSEQAAGMASYVAAYRIGMLVSSAGALFLVTYFESSGYPRTQMWGAAYAVMAALVAIGMITTLMAREPASSQQALLQHQGKSPFQRVIATAFDAFRDLLSRDLALAALAFVVLFKLTDAFSGAMIGPFVIKLGFSREDYAYIVKGFGLIATLAGGFAGGYLARALPMTTCLWIGGILQAVANLAFSAQALVGVNHAMLMFAITAENFTSAIGTVIFVAYLSAMCRNPLHTATQYALLTALSAVGRTFLPTPSGYVAELVGWPMFFVIACLIALPSFILLAYLQKRQHFEGLNGIRS